MKAVAPKPVNFLNRRRVGFTVQGHRRHGRAPHQRRRHAGARRDARLHQVGDARSPSEGKFDSFAGVVSNAELNKFFGDDAAATKLVSRDRTDPTPASRSACRSTTTPAQRPGAGRRCKAATAASRSSRRATPPRCGRRSKATTRSGPICRATARSPTQTTFAACIAKRAPRSTIPTPTRSSITTGRARRLFHADGNPPATCASSKSATSLYSPALQRTPLGTEAQYLLARYAFETLGYRRYEWKCNALNAPRAAPRCATASVRGHVPPALIAKGRNRDTAWFSMLDSEWPARKARLRALAGAGEFRRRRHGRKSA